MQTLNDQLLAAHDADDRAGLVTLYQQAADDAQSTDAACFFLTQAYIFALELNHADTADLHARLKTNGRV